MKPPVVISWSAALLAPLVVPVLGSAVLTLAMPGRNPLGGFLFFAMLGSLFAWGVMFTFFLPMAWLMSRFTALNRWRLVLLGTAIGIALLLPVTWVGYRASGDDSGPPETSYPAYLLQMGFDSFLFFFPLASAITSLVYAWLADRRSGSAD